MLFPLDLGLFNIRNKFLVALDILQDWWESLKLGTPLTNIITAKMHALLKKVPNERRPEVSKFKYHLEILYDGYYGFECMTLRSLDDVICGYCGIAGKIYFGDGNEKNCCGLKGIDVSDSSNPPVSPSSNDALSSNNIQSMTTMLDEVKLHLVERSTFAKHRQEFRINYKDIPPLIAPSNARAELNTEGYKKSGYLENPQNKVKGDAIMLEKLFKDGKIQSIDDVESMSLDSLRQLCKQCMIPTSLKSMAMLRLDLRTLYATILVGSSNCHQFVKAEGHTGGFYHIVCRHGTTVASKFMVLTESVRDAADLWLSLKYPPVLFVCDTPCTFTRHINQRSPDEAIAYWGENDGCFEVPTLGKDPEPNKSVPDIVPGEHSDSNTVAHLYLDQKVHPVTGKTQRYVCGDRFHAKKNPHKSPLCAYHNIDLCQQAKTVKTSYQESQNNQKNEKRNRSSCSQNFLHHIMYNYLMNFYDNERVVLKQLNDIKERTGQKEVVRDEFGRFQV
ncbi:HMG domain-containing protein 3-like [Clytia hemisphaerica]|uniref:Uncharacterized protein n=1 Tax=Clytia hemisphaerica TaxID=252671 RepID=A0A7M5V8I1_9CNID|eukprot:TCONS_00039938-protein